MNKATELTGQLLQFSNQQPMKPTILNPNEVVQELTGMLKNFLKKNITLIKNLSKEMSNVLVDRGQPESVITNLVVNAKHAMKNGGSLTISTFSRDSSVYITVSDSGEGIPEET